MKKELAIFLNLIVTANAGTILDGAACTKTEDCKGYIEANPSSGSVCNPCVLGSYLVYLCTPYADPTNIPKELTTDYGFYKPNCNV